MVEPGQVPKPWEVDTFDDEQVIDWTRVLFARGYRTDEIAAILKRPESLIYNLHIQIHGEG